MAKCPSCECELAGMERVCRDCFEKQYAVVTSGKKDLRAEQFLVPSIAVVIFSIVFLVTKYFPTPMEQASRALGISLQVGKLLLAGVAVGWGIWESLKWRSAQNLLFWVVVALNLAALVLWLLRHEWYWFLLLAVTFYLNKRMSAFQEQRAA